MAVDNLTRNLRDGQIDVLDGGGNSVTLTLEEGDLNWTENEDAKEILDRGVLDHVRDGDEQPIDLNFTVKMTNLIAAAVTGSSDPNRLYEMVNNVASTYTSVLPAGEKFALHYDFSVSAPAGASLTGERIEFGKVYKVSLACGEGDDFNTIAFTGRDFETAPTIVRI